jgi:hypothetical protein
VGGVEERRVPGELHRIERDVVGHDDPRVVHAERGEALVREHRRRLVGDAEDEARLRRGGRRGQRAGDEHGEERGTGGHGAAR